MDANMRRPGRSPWPVAALVVAALVAALGVYTLVGPYRAVHATGSVYVCSSPLSQPTSTVSRQQFACAQEAKIRVGRGLAFVVVGLGGLVGGEAWRRSLRSVD